MKIKKTLNETTSRSEYNKVYKRYLENSGKIHCSFCSYHRGENDTRKWYGSTRFWSEDGEKSRVKYPSWKLVSKNRKQWMKKELRIINKDISKV